MSQNPNGGPNYNPYGPNLSNPNYPPAPGTAYGGSQPPSGPNSYGQYAPPPPSGPGDNTPHSSYGPYGTPYAPPPPGMTPMPPTTDPVSGPYGPYDQTVLSQQNSSPSYPSYAPPSNPGFGVPPAMPPNPMPRKSNSKNVLIAVIALVVVVGGILGVVLYNNHQTAVQHANGTATAQAQVTGTAQAYARATANVQATATYISTHYPFSTNLVLNDPLNDNSHVSQYGWDVDPSCAFSDGTYHVYEKTANRVHLCVANTPTFTNFTFETQMAIKAGGSNAEGGVIFRADTTNDKFYILYLDTRGNYDLDIEVNNVGDNNRTLKQGTVAGYAAGFFQVHTIGIVANGSQISLYIDQKQIAQVTDTTYTSGQIGFISSYGTSPSDVVYNNAKVWQIS